MERYIHVDRTQSLRPGDTIQLEPYLREESRLTLLAPCMKSEFAAHLEALLRQGLSLHGARYLLTAEQVDMGSLMTELVYEEYRRTHFPETVSRLQAFFTFQSIRDAVRFAGDGQRIYQIESDELGKKLDMNALKLSYDTDEQVRYAEPTGQENPQVRMRTISRIGRFFCICQLRLCGKCFSWSLSCGERGLK